MTVSSVTQMWSRDTSSESTTDGKSFTRTYRTAYQVEHAADTTQDQIRDASGVPAMGSSYPDLPNVYVKNKTVETVGPIFSIVNVDYEGESSGPDGDDPVNTKASWRITNAKTQEPIDTDGFGFPLTNVNGEPVYGFTKPISDLALNVEQKFASFNTFAFIQYLDSVSSDQFGPPGNQWPAGTAHLDSLSVQSSDDDDYVTANATFLFRYPYLTTNDRAWWLRYRNEGFYERAGTRVTFAAAPGNNSTATGYAVVSSGGAITKIVVTNSGNGYTTAPAVSIASDTSGTGASATATINSNGRVTGVTIGAGGSNYASKIVRAKDGNKEDVSKPVLLDFDGTRLDDAESAVFLERPLYSNYLPYNAIGFNF